MPTRARSQAVGLPTSGPGPQWTRPDLGGQVPGDGSLTSLIRYAKTNLSSKAIYDQHGEPSGSPHINKPIRRDRQC
jgi:hypothetical protein